MSEEWIGIVWIIGGGISFALLGALFGALATGLHRRSGKASGSWIGKTIAGALSELFDHELTATQQAALIGAGDGAVFLGGCGVLVGMIAHFSGAKPATWMQPGLLLLVGILGGAIAFGLFARAILRAKIRSIFALSVGGMIGIVIATLTVGGEHVIPGALVGSVLGFSCHLLLLRS